MQFIQKNKKTIAITLLLIMMLTMLSTAVFAGGVGNHIGSNNRSSSSGSSGSSGSGDSFIVYLIFRLLFSPFGVFLLILYGIGFVLHKKDVESKPGIYLVKFYEGTTKLITIIKNSSDESYSSSSNQASAKYVPDNTEEITREIQKTDPDFSSYRFLSWAESVFIKINTAWTKKEWELIRSFENEHLFNLHSQQLQQYIDSETTNYIKNVMVNQSYLYTYDRDDNYEYLKVVLKSRLISYVLDDKTGRLLEGDKNEEVYMDYVMTFMRTNGTKTKPGKSNLSTSKCPNCGAPTKITNSGKCEYCEEVITTGDHDWVLSDFDSVQSDTIIDRTPITITESTSKSSNADDIKEEKDSAPEALNHTLCDDCGGKNEKDANFCEFCGNSLE